MVGLHAPANVYTCRFMYITHVYTMYVCTVYRHVHDLIRDERIALAGAFVHVHVHVHVYTYNVHVH